MRSRPLGVLARIAFGALAALSATTAGQHTSVHVFDRQPDGAEQLIEELRQRYATDGIEGEGETERGTPFFILWDWSRNDEGSFWAARADVEGNVVVVSSFGNFVDGFTTRVEKINGAQNSNPPDVIWTVDIPDISRPRCCEIDLDGNIYIGGGSIDSFSSRPDLAKVSPDGYIVWKRSYQLPGGVAGNALSDFRDLTLDPDGTPFGVVGVDDSNETVFALRIDPVTGNIAWVSDLEAEQQCIAELNYLAPKIQTGRSGQLYVSALTQPLGSSLLASLDPRLGKVEWCQPLTLAYSTIAENPLAIAPNGDVLLGGRDGLDGVLTRYAPSGGQVFEFPVFDSTNSAYEISTVKISKEGWIAIGGAYIDLSGSKTDAGFVQVYDETNFIQWRQILGYNPVGDPASFPEGVLDLAFDRFGNPYATVLFRDGDDTITSSIKLNRDDGAVLWFYFEPTLFPQFTDVFPAGLIVDPGANVFSVTTQNGPGGVTGKRVRKFGQPYNGSVPTVQTACAELSFENQSIWAPGTGHMVVEQDLFSINWNDGVDEDLGFTIPIAGEFGGGFSFLTDGVLDAGVRAEVNGGSADVHLPLDIEFTFPSINKLGPGSVVTVEVEWTPDPAARLTSCFTPTFNAGFTAGVDYSVYSDAYLRAFSEDLFNTVFVDVERSLPVDYVPGMNLLDILALAGAPTPGEWSTIELPPKGLFTAEFRTPQMFAQGRYNPAMQSFSTDTTDRFFSFDISVTEAILRSVGATANFEFEFPSSGGDGGDDNNGSDDEEEQPSSDFGITGDGQVLQLLVGVEMGARQQIDVGVVPMVRYEFSDGIPTQTIPITQDLVFTLPSKPFDGTVEIRPTLVSSADFMNATDIEIFPGLGWITLEASLSAFAFGFDVLSLGPYCFGCFDWDLSEILEALGIPNPNAVNLALTVFDDFWQIPFDEVPLPCMRVLASTTNRPNLEAASRETMDMLIYDQTSPSQASFNVTTGGTTKMLLYGVRMASDSQAFIEHWGREEAIPTTHINDSTLLIEVPDRFRLLPGIAKLYVIASGLESDSIDMPVAYPRPRLDAVNPNLWAADPDLAALPIAVIDGRSFVGNDTFIARRDYFIKLRDDLWSDTTDGGFAGGAAEYFPHFDFNQMPGFPAVLWGGGSGGMPLPRFVQPVDNGIHNVRLGEDQYNRPQLVPVVICNPGPGGGMSNELELTIAAPTPVASSIEPNGMSPSDIVFDDNYFDPGDTPVARAVELRVMGPAHVPSFQGYEEPKYGNFNADSVVRFNGIDLPTTFVSSFLLEADLPPEMVTLGDHAITVFSPSNGTFYFEELRVDADGDGLPDPEPVLQELVESGGESAPLLFRIRYREPVIDSVSPNLVEAGSIAFDDSMLPKAQPYNVTLQGEDFRDGAVVLINGVERDTQFVGPTMLRAKLLPEDVSVIGTYPVRVRNPGPDHQVSGSRLFKVAVPSRSLRASTDGDAGGGHYGPGRVARP